LTNRRGSCLDGRGIGCQNDVGCGPSSRASHSACVCMRRRSRTPKAMERRRGHTRPRPAFSGAGDLRRGNDCDYLRPMVCRIGERRQCVKRRGEILRVSRETWPSAGESSRRRAGGSSAGAMEPMMPRMLNRMHRMRNEGRAAGMGMRRLGETAGAKFGERPAQETGPMDKEWVWPMRAQTVAETAREMARGMACGRGRGRSREDRAMAKCRLQISNGKVQRRWFEGPRDPATELAWPEARDQRAG
jgi:hypothetical protein